MLDPDYSFEKGEMEGEQDSGQDSSDGNENDVNMNQDEFERIDSRGKKITLFRTQIQHDVRFTDPSTQQQIISFA
jgi:hypothetical protein